MKSIAERINEIYIVLKEGLAEINKDLVKVGESTVATYGDAGNKMVEVYNKSADNDRLWKSTLADKTRFDYLFENNALMVAPPEYFNLSKATRALDIFNGCSCLQYLHENVGGSWTSLTNLQEAFQNCYEFKGIKHVSNGLEDYGFYHFNNNYYECHPIDLSACTTLKYAFMYCTKLKKVAINIPNVMTMTRTFAFCNSLESINSQEVVFENLGYVFNKITPIDFSSVTTFDSCFRGCTELMNIDIVSGSIHADISFVYSEKLTERSLSQIVNGLADMSGEETKTLSLSQASADLLSQEQKDLIASKNWSLVV